MDQNQITLPRRQQAFDFAKSEMWQRLPADSRRDCQACLTLLLLQVLSRHRRDENEREDQS
jgi:hypothetical protein